MNIKLNGLKSSGYKSTKFKICTVSETYEGVLSQRGAKAVVFIFPADGSETTLKSVNLIKSCCKIRMEWMKVWIRKRWGFLI